MNLIENILAKQKILIIDGAFGTQLEKKGYDINDPLWSAQFLSQNPQAIAQVHLEYLEAGADCIITSSYQASFEGFMKRGFSEEKAKELIQSSVKIAQKVRDDFWENEQNKKNREKPLVAASVGPYGAYLADGSEYVGKYDRDEKGLRDFHTKRLQTLASAAPDILACETIPCLLEAKALGKLLEDYPQIYSWVCFSAKDGFHISSGEKILDCAQWIATQEHINAIGINCTAPQYVASLITQIRKMTDKAIVVYPNGGGSYNAITKTWSNEADTSSFAKMAHLWYETGATLIGGCCQTTPEDIKQIAKWAKTL
jgi:homocysteine S-methyltransferase